MLIWRGWGWLTLVFALATWGIGAGIFVPIYKSVTGEEYAFAPVTTLLVGIAGIIVAGAMAAFVIFALPRIEWVPQNSEQTQAYIEARKARAAAVKAGQPVEPRPLPKFWKTRSSTFFIPMWVQPVIFLAIGTLMIVLNVGEASQQAS